ncbi:MAG: trypsin-like peptidase domain-containing protein [Lewinella sp.]|nr:trypsin-like peptidase domain-containing protein [Lewinella sp.]
MKSSFVKLLIAILLVIGGFLAGSYWNKQQISNIEAEGTDGKAVEVRLKTEETPMTEDAVAAPTTDEQLNPDELHTIRLFENASPSVCFITTSTVRRDYWTRDVMEIPSGTGSGFVWSKQGHIITNYHVIKGANRAQVTLSDQSTWDAELVGYAPEKDLAVLRIEAPANELVPIPRGTSGNLRVGQNVYAIGNPFGLDHTLTTGIVSALGREIKSDAGIPIRDVIQSDAAINPGNSGGPLLDSSGKLIGVNTAIYSPSGASAGIGFSIPVDVVNWVVPELIAYGKVKRPSLGFTTAEKNIMQRLGLKGAMVWSVDENSNASRAGIQPTYRDRYGRISLGDRIVKMNEEEINSSDDLILELEKYEPGDEVTFVLVRDNKTYEVTLELESAQ